MKKVLILLSTSCLAAPVFAGSLDSIPPQTTPIAAPAANSFGGFVTGYYGGASVADEGCCDYDDPSYTYWGAEASVGGGIGAGRLGWQLDLDYEVANDPDPSDGYYESYGGTVHVNFDLSGTRIGVFGGLGAEENYNDGDGGTGYWYGVEAAREFGNIALAAQIGMASSDNNHDSLDYNDEIFGQVQARYFVNDRMMVTGNVGYGAGIIHGDPMDFMLYGVEGAMQLGQSNFYARAGYEGLWASEDHGADDVTNESRFYAGLSFVFGGGSLRDTYTGSTPMINGSINNLVAVYTSTLD